MAKEQQGDQKDLAYDISRRYTRHRSNAKRSKDGSNWLIKDRKIWMEMQEPCLSPRKLSSHSGLDFAI